MGRKIFRFVLEIDGVDQVLIQEVKKPKVEVGVVEHGVANGKTEKTAGGTTVSDAELKKIKPEGGSDSWAWDLMIQAQTGVAADYKFDAVFKELAPDGVTTLNSWLWIGCFIKSPEDAEFKKGIQNENLIETVMISVDDVERIR